MRVFIRASPGLRTLATTSPFSTMASTAGLPFKMHVTPDNTGLWRIKQTDEAAKKVSELLQKDMEKHHVFFNDDHFHNHIPHHLFSLYGTGAGPPALDAAYARNKTYQRPALPPHRDPPVAFLPWPSAAAPYFGREEYYPDFLRFFQAEIARLGSWQAVVARYVLNLDADADADAASASGSAPATALEKEPLLPRLFAGFLHPLIQLMYGVEWGQEAVVAEGLAEAAVHRGDIGEFLFAAEARAREQEAREADGKGGRQKQTVMELIAEVRRNDALAHAARYSDANKVRDGVLARARDEMVALAARVRVRPEELDEKTAEMFDATVFVAAAAALLKEGIKQPKFDFFLMHHVNACPFFVAINQQDWLPVEAKTRLLEWKIRMDLLQYAARGVPELSAEKLAGYRPRKPDAGGSLSETVARLHPFPDDGHAIKLGRAAVICRDICKKYEDQGKDWLKVKGDDMWSRVCHLIVDSVEAPGDNWVRSAGFDEAWKDIPDV